MKTIKITNRKIIDVTTTNSNVFDMFGSRVAEGSLSYWVTRRWYGIASEHSKTHLYSKIVVNGAEIDFGEDPRGIMLNGSLHITASLYSHDHGFRNKIIIAAKDGSYNSYQIIAPKKVGEGKNWIICDFGSPKIHLIHSYSPLIILKEVFREKSAIIFESIEVEGLSCSEFTDNYPIYRGGSPGVNTPHGVIGVGHTTRKSFLNNVLINTHRPFFWTISDSYKISQLECQHDFNYGNRVIDVTGLTFEGNKNFSMYTFECQENLFLPDNAISFVKYDFELR